MGVVVIWLDEIILVVSLSKKTKAAIVIGVIFFIGINLAGLYLVQNIEIDGGMEIFRTSIVERLADKYDKAAFLVLFSSWLLAFRCYQKDKKRFLK